MYPRHEIDFVRRHVNVCWRFNMCRCEGFLPDWYFSLRNLADADRETGFGRRRLLAILGEWLATPDE